MDLQQQPRNPNDLLIFKNIDDEDFEWQFDAIRTPLPYYIKAGETRQLPYYIGRHGVEKIIDKLIYKEGRNPTDRQLRYNYLKRIVLGVKHINETRPPTEQELALKAMQRKKDADLFEELFKERELEIENARIREEEERKRIQTPLYMTQGKPTAKEVAAEEERMRKKEEEERKKGGYITQTIQDPSHNNPIAENTPSDTQPVVTDPAKEAANQAAMDLASPERQYVYNFLKNRAHLDITHQPTKEKLDAMSVNQIKEEFGQEFPDIIDPERALVPDSKADLSQAGMPVTPGGNPVTPQPSTPAPITEAPAAPSIPMNPAAPGAPLLDQQLQGVK